MTESQEDKEFQQEVREAMNIAWSPYAQFHITHTGYKFYRRGVEVDKWEVFGNDLKYYERIPK